MTLLNRKSPCSQWADQHSKHLSLSNRARLDEHVTTCPSCQDACNQHQRIAQSLQSIPVPAPLPDITFQQLLSKEGTSVRKKCRRRYVVVLAFVLFITYGVASFAFLWSVVPGLYWIGSVALLLTSISILFHRGTWLQEKTLCLMLNKVNKADLHSRHEQTRVKRKKVEIVKLVKQFFIIGFMLLVLASPSILMYVVGRNFTLFLPTLTVGLVPYYVSSKRVGEMYVFKIQSILWGFSTRRFPFQAPQDEVQIPLLSIILETLEVAKNLRHVRNILI